MTKENLMWEEQLLTGRLAREIAGLFEQKL